MEEKILIVDEDIKSLKLIGLMFQREGYQIVAANTANQALERAVIERPDLIVTEVELTDLDGYELCKRLRADPRTQDTPIIIFTARTEVEDKVSGYEAGADDYLAKPAHPTELLSRVQNVLERQNAPQEAAAEMKVLSFIGVKGGIGTTTLALNIAAGLSKKLPTAFIDFRPGVSMLGFHFGLDHQRGLANVLDHYPTDAEADPREIEALLESEMVALAPGLKMLLSSSDPEEAQITIRPAIASEIVKAMRDRVSHVVLDLGTGLTPLNRTLLDETHRVFIVSDSRRFSVMAARNLLQTLYEKLPKWKSLDVIMTQQPNADHGISWQQAEYLLGQELFGIISWDGGTISRAIEAQKPVILHAPASLIASQVQKLIQALET